jgi:hypothetical protein
MSDEQGARLELYRLAVDMADRVSARRGTANAFFLALNTALAGVVGFVRPSSSATGGVIRVDVFGIVLVSLVGVVLSAAWWLLLRSYRDLNEAKFKVINAMEEGLPAHPFGDEWRYLKEDPIKKKFPARYAELNVVERIVPVAFALVYVAVGVRALCS